MENKIVLGEVSGSQDVKALEGCTIISVTAADEDGEGLCLDCKDEDGNLVSFLITREGTWHLHNSKDFVKKSPTVEQYGKLAKLIDEPMVDSVNINNASPVAEFVVKVFGREAADRVLTEINSIFPMLEIGGESEWDFEGIRTPMYQCSDLSYSATITVAVIPENDIKDLGRN